jgi:hypothetical protein
VTGARRIVVVSFIGLYYGRTPAYPFEHFSTVAHSSSLPQCTWHRLYKQYIMSPRSQDDDEEVIEQEEEEEEENERRQQRKKLKLMDESGLTEAERRRIRQSQRDIQRSLRETVEEVGFAELEQVRQKNNQVFQSSVLYTREGRSFGDSCID